MRVNYITSRNTKHSLAFTLIELCVVIVIILLLMTSLVSVGFVLKGRSRMQKTKATMAVLETCVEQYYSQRKEYPAQLVECYDTNISSSQVSYYQSAATKDNAVIANNAYLRWQLMKMSSVRDMLSQISDKYIPYKDDAVISKSAAAINDVLSKGWGKAKDPSDVDYAYFIDDYGRPFNYQKSGGTGGSFVVISAGEDEQFDTDDDIRSGHN